jgi:hypothetical protein
LTYESTPASFAPTPTALAGDSGYNTSRGFQENNSNSIHRSVLNSPIASVSKPIVYPGSSNNNNYDGPQIENNYSQYHSTTHTPPQPRYTATPAEYYGYSSVQHPRSSAYTTTQVGPDYSTAARGPPSGVPAFNGPAIGSTGNSDIYAAYQSGGRPSYGATGYGGGFFQAHYDPVTRKSYN